MGRSLIPQAGSGIAHVSSWSTWGGGPASPQFSDILPGKAFTAEIAEYAEKSKDIEVGQKGFLGELGVLGGNRFLGRRYYLCYPIPPS